MNAARWKDVWRRFSGRGIYPHELAALLLFPLRRFVFSPAKLVRHLHLTRTSRVLEVGPGQVSSASMSLEPFRTGGLNL
jgi:hypothetical protein